MKRRHSWRSFQRYPWRKENCEECGEEQYWKTNWDGPVVCEDCDPTDECPSCSCPNVRASEFLTCESCGEKGCGDLVDGMNCHRTCSYCGRVHWCNYDSNLECSEGKNCEACGEMCAGCFVVKENHGQPWCFWKSKQRFAEVLEDTFLEAVAEDIYGFCIK